MEELLRMRRGREFQVLGAVHLLDCSNG